MTLHARSKSFEITLKSNICVHFCDVEVASNIIIHLKSDLKVRIQTPHVLCSENPIHQYYHWYYLLLNNKYLGTLAALFMLKLQTGLKTEADRFVYWGLCFWSAATGRIFTFFDKPFKSIPLMLSFELSCNSLMKKMRSHTKDQYVRLT